MCAELVRSRELAVLLIFWLLVVQVAISAQLSPSFHPVCTRCSRGLPSSRLRYLADKPIDKASIEHHAGKSIRPNEGDPRVIGRSIT